MKSKNSNNSNEIRRNDVNPKEYNTNCDGIPFDESFNVASATECTGLIPSAPVGMDEITSYEDIYDVPLSPVIAENDD